MHRVVSNACACMLCTAAKPAATDSTFNSSDELHVRRQCRSRTKNLVGSMDNDLDSLKELLRVRSDTCPTADERP
jgi:hypothetical protein